MAKPKLMGIREYARHRAVRVSTVQAAIDAGRIPIVTVDGRKKIDWKAADKSWKENTDPARQNRKPVAKEPEPAPNPQDKSFAKARAVRETFQAKMAALRYQTQAKEVVSVAKVKSDWFRIGRTVRDALNSAPDRIASVIAAKLGLPEKDFMINAIMAEEIRLILEELTNAGKRLGYEADPIPEPIAAEEAVDE